MGSIWQLFTPQDARCSVLILRSIPGHRSQLLAAVLLLWDLSSCWEGVEGPSCCQTWDWRSWVGEVWLWEGTELSASREHGKGECPCERGEVLGPSPGHWTRPAALGTTERERMMFKGA